MKLQKILMTGCRDMDKKIKNTPKMGVTPQDFFQKLSSVTFVPLWYPNFMQKIKKTNEQYLRYLKTDRWTHGQGRLLRTPTGKPEVQNERKR